MLWPGKKTGLRIEASAVATQEATDEDSNALRGKTASEAAVAIRKPAGAGKGYRICAMAYPPRTASARRRAISSRISALCSSPTPRKGRAGMTLPGWRTALRTTLSPLRL